MPFRLGPKVKMRTRRRARKGFREENSARRTAFSPDPRSRVRGRASACRLARVLALATLLAATAAGLLPGAVSAAAPSNDNFANATLVTSNKQTFSGTNVDATLEPQWEGEWWGMPLTWEPVPAVWYKVEPSADARLYIKITGSGFYPAVEAFKVVNDPPTGAVVTNRDHQSLNYEAPRRAITTASLAPKLPRMLTARLVSGTRVGRAVRVRYCFGLLPKNPWTRPWRLHLTLDNVRDKQLPLSIPWRVRSRCGTILHPVGGIKVPYVLRYFVASRRDTRSQEAQIAVR